jgi:hypothetical protein
LLDFFFVVTHHEQTPAKPLYSQSRWFNPSLCRALVEFHFRKLYRVNFEVSDLKPFPHLAFPHFARPENSSRQLSFDGELMASSLSLLKSLFLPHGVTVLVGRRPFRPTRTQDRFYPGLPKRNSTPELEELMPSGYTMEAKEFLEFVYPEVRDLCEHFLTLVSGILIFSVTFSEKI